MKQFILLFLTTLVLLASTKAQDVEEISIDQLLQRVEQSSDTLYLVNFWATWCPPCVEELPIFDSDELKELHEHLKVLLVSLDFKSQKEKLLIPFLQKKQVKQEVLLLNERNPNEWIDKINAGWSGAIPTTVVYHQNKQVFHEGELDLPQLLKLVSSINQ